MRVCPNPFKRVNSLSTSEKAARDRAKLKAARAADRERNKYRHRREELSLRTLLFLVLAPLLLMIGGGIAVRLARAQTPEPPVHGTQFEWTPAGTLASVTHSSGKKVTYEYDAEGNMVSRRYFEADGSLLKDTRFLVDDENATGMSQIVAEIDGVSGRVEKENTWGEGLLSQTYYKPDGRRVVRRPMCDGLGSVRTVIETDDAGNETTTHHDYTAFGALLDPPPAIGYAFAGQCRDPATGLQFHRARWYDPQIGQWISGDPKFDFPGGFGHAYAYAAQDPVNKTDPKGDQTLGEVLSALYTQGQLAAIRLGPHAILVSEIAWGLTAGDAGFGPSPFPSVGSAVGNETRALASQAIEAAKKAEGWVLLAKQTRDNGAGIDYLFRKAGTSIADNTAQYLAMEEKVSGVTTRFQSMLGQAKYGWQMSEQWITENLGRIEKVIEKPASSTGIKVYENMTKAELNFIRKNLKDVNRVQKMLVGGQVVEDGLAKGNPSLVCLWEFDLHFGSEYGGQPIANLISNGKYAVLNPSGVFANVP